MSESKLSPELKRICLEALILCALSFAVGLSLNYQLVMNAFTGKVERAVEKVAPAEKIAGSPVEEDVLPDPIYLDEIDELQPDDVLFVDARNIDDYKAGHLKGAVSLPIGEYQSHRESFMEKVPLDQDLILYCNGFGCPDSFDLAVLMLKDGYQNVRVYEGGFPEWRDEGRAVEEGLQ